MRHWAVVAGMVGVLGPTACSSADSGVLSTEHRATLGANGTIVAGSSSETGSGTGADSSGSASSGASVDDLEHCVDVINSYRAEIGAPAYGRSSTLEQFAAEGAQSDAESGQAHGHFVSTGGGDGVAFAEDEAPGWPVAPYGGTIDGVVDASMKAMWAEGPSGGHYQNMASTQYSQAGCGFYMTSSGDLWVTTDFR